MSGVRGGATYSPGPALQDMSVIADGGGHSWALHVSAHPGNNQDTATPMRACLNIVDTAANPGDSVGMPPAFGGQMVYVINRTGNSISIYPAAGTTDAIYNSDGTEMALSTPLTLGAYDVAMFYSTPGEWALTAAPASPSQGEVGEAPTDGFAYVRSMQSWVNADARYVTPTQIVPASGGNFTGAVGFSPQGFNFPAMGTANAAYQFAWSGNRIWPYVNAIAQGQIAYTSDITVASVAGKTGAVTLLHGDITDWTAATAMFALTTQIPAASSTLPVMDGTAAIGTSPTWALADHEHPSDTSRYAASNPSGYQTAAQVTAVVPVSSSAPPVMNGAVGAGSGAAWSRGDHIHPSDTSRLPLIGGTLSGDVTVGTNTAGQALTFNGPDATQPGRSISFQTAGVPRWQLHVGQGVNSSNPETGSSSGGILWLDWFHDDGTRDIVPAASFSRRNLQAAPGSTLELGGDLLVDGSTRFNGTVTLAADPAAAMQAATQQYADTKLPLIGGTLSNGLSFGAASASGITLTRHLTMHTAGYGILVSTAAGGSQRYVVPTGGGHGFYIGTAQQAFIGPTEIDLNLPTFVYSTLQLNADPTTALQAATKQYVDRTKIGTTTNDNAAAGQIGEYLSAQRLSTATVALTTNVDAVVTALSLTAGDWDVWGSVGYNLNNNNQTTLASWINPAAATKPSVDQMGGLSLAPIENNQTQAVMPVTHMRVSIAAPATVTLGATATFSGTISAFGKIMARRRR